MKKPTRIYATIVIFTIIASALTFCGRKSHNGGYRTDYGLVWNTEFSITYQSDRNMYDSVLSVLAEIDNSASMFNPASTISKFNDGAISEVDDIIADLYTTAKRVSSLSGGLYDPTVAPLVNAWGFGKDKSPHKALTQTEIDSILQFVGIDKTEIKDRTIMRNDNRIVFDFSSIAKGYACDAIGQMLERNGITNYLVEIGGEIASHGINASGSKWHISIDCPDENADSIIHNCFLLIESSGTGIATSGNYRNFYTNKNGEVISHIINPITGYCERNTLLSATIVADNAALADALATACMTMGVEQSIKMIQATDGIEALLIYTDIDGKEIYTWASDNLPQVKD